MQNVASSPHPPPSPPPESGRDEGRLYRTLYFHTDIEYVSRLYVALCHNIVASVRASVSVSKMSQKAYGRVTRLTDDVIVTISVRPYTLRKQNRENKKYKQGLSEYSQPPGTLVELWSELLNPSFPPSIISFLHLLAAKWSALSLFFLSKKGIFGDILKIGYF